MTESSAFAQINVSMHDDHDSRSDFPNKQLSCPKPYPTGKYGVAWILPGQEGGQKNIYFM